MVRLLGLFLILFALPAQVFAGVFVSEVAWMGTEVSSSNEWIELANDGTQSATLDGWTLKAKDGSPSIVLSGTILSGGYFLIERTDDESVPNIPADLVTPFGKGLSNEGETLELRDASGTVIDMVVGGKDWKSIGGDAKTKLTAQKRGSVWMSAKATPRAAPPIPPPPAPAPIVEKKIETPALAPLHQEPDPTVSIEPTPSPKEEISKPELKKIYGDSPLEEEEKTIPLTSLSLLGALLLLGSGGVLYLRGKTKTEAERYSIVQDDGDDEG